MILAGHAFEFRVRLVPGRYARAGAWGSRRGCRSTALRRGPEPFSALIASRRREARSSSGIDEETAVIGRDGGWQVHGRPRDVWRGHQRERFHAGETFRL